MAKKESIVEIMEQNKIILAAEFQKGYQTGFIEAERRITKEYLDFLNRIIKTLDEHWPIVNAFTELWAERKKWRKRANED